MPQVNKLPMPNRALSDLLREIGLQITYDHTGTEMTNNEALARHLWEIALNKKTTLVNGTEVSFSAGEWIDVVWRLIERMDGKAPQSINATVTPGISLTRKPRFEEPAALEPADLPPLPSFDGASDPTQMAQSVIAATVSVSLGALANGAPEAQPSIINGDVHD